MEGRPCVPMYSPLRSIDEDPSSTAITANDPYSVQSYDPSCDGLDTGWSWTVHSLLSSQGSPASFPQTPASAYDGTAGHNFPSHPTFGDDFPAYDPNAPPVPGPLFNTLSNPAEYATAAANHHDQSPCADYGLSTADVSSQPLNQGAPDPYSPQVNVPPFMPGVAAGNGQPARSNYDSQNYGGIQGQRSTAADSVTAAADLFWLDEVDVSSQLLNQGAPNPNPSQVNVPPSMPGVAAGNGQPARSNYDSQNYGGIQRQRSTSASEYEDKKLKNRRATQNYRKRMAYRLETAERESGEKDTVIQKLREEKDIMKGHYQESEKQRNQLQETVELAQRERNEARSREALAQVKVEELSRLLESYQHGGVVGANHPVTYAHGQS